MTDGVTLNGNWTLPGVAVDVCIAGLDCGTITTNLDGSLFVPFGADPDGLFTAGYLNSISDSTSTNPALTTFNITNGDGDVLTVSVPVLIGYSYQSVGWCLRPTTEGQTKSPLGGAVGKRRRMQRAGLEFINAQGVAIGNKQGNTDAVQFKDSGLNTTTKDVLFSGIMQLSVRDTNSYDGQLYWEIVRPYPCTVVSVTTFLEIEEA